MSFPRQIARREGIGASEVPAIAGASPWQTPVALWLAKVGLGEGDETPAMVAGRDLEWPLLRMGAAREGITLRHNRQRHAHPDWPAVPLYATPDGFGPGRQTIAEVKLVGHRFSDWRDGPPDYVNLQVQAQLACIRPAERALVIALLGSELRTFHVLPDPDVQRELPGLVTDWWQRHVVREVAPDATGPGDQWALLRAAVSGDRRAERLATPDEQAIGADVAGLLAERDALDEQIERRRLVMAQIAETTDVAGLGWSARWGRRASVDWRALAKVADPEWAAHAPAYTRTSTVFTFRRQGDPA